MFWVSLIKIHGKLTDQQQRFLADNCTHVRGPHYIYEGDTELLDDENFEWEEIAQGDVPSLGDLSEDELVALCDTKLYVKLEDNKDDRDEWKKGLCECPEGTPLLKTDLAQVCAECRKPKPKFVAQHSLDHWEGVKATHLLHLIAYEDLKKSCPPNMEALLEQLRKAMYWEEEEPRQLDAAIWLIRNLDSRIADTQEALVDAAQRVNTCKEQLRRVGR